jgi:hypothetical protein
VPHSIAGGSAQQILTAYIGKEELRALFSTVGVGGDPHLTRNRLLNIFAWWPEINAFLRTGITNARTEGYNRLVKSVNRSACGFRNRENSARRIRFHGTRRQRVAARQFSC